MVRMKRKYAHIQALALAAAAIIYMGLKALPFTKSAIAKDELITVARVVDGDTLKLSDGRKVRLIGVDTPELHYSEKLLRDSKRSHKDIKAIQELGRSAAAFTRGLVQDKG